MTRRRARVRAALLFTLAALLLAELLLPVPRVRDRAAVLRDDGAGGFHVHPGPDPRAALHLPAASERPRVLWFGASTIAGVPFDPELSPPRLLDALFELHGVPFEVRGVAAAGSTLADQRRWIDALLELRPRAVLLTTGHNEFLRTQDLQPVWWRRSALLARLFQRLGVARPAHHAPDPARPLDVARVAAAAAEELAAVRAACAAADVPLLVFEPVCNLADWAPMLGAEADAAWARAGEAAAAGDAEARVAALVEARDRDAWPWRAPSALTAALAAVLPLRPEASALFAEASGGGPPGDGLFVDHVHPTLEGQRLLALAAWRALAAEGLSPSPPDAPARLPRLVERLGAPTGLGHRGLRWGLRTRLRAALLRPDGGPRLAELLARRDDPVLHTAQLGAPVLLALLASDAPGARAAWERAAAEERAALRDQARKYPWVAAAFARGGLASVLAEGDAPRGNPVAPPPTHGEAADAPPLVSPASSR